MKKTAGLIAVLAVATMCTLALVLRTAPQTALAEAPTLTAQVTGAEGVLIFTQDNYPWWKGVIRGVDASGVLFHCKAGSQSRGQEWRPYERVAFLPWHRVFEIRFAVEAK